MNRNTVMQTRQNKSKGNFAGSKPGWLPHRAEPKRRKKNRADENSKQDPALTMDPQSAHLTIFDRLAASGKLSLK